MSAAFRRIVHLLLITLVVNASGWTFNREAVADTLQDALQIASQTTQTDDAATAAQPAEGQPDIKGVVCNHWCHAVDHLVGIFSLHPTLLMEATNAYSVSKPSILHPSLPEGLYRPPRIFS